MATKKWKNLYNNMSPERQACVEARVEEALKDRQAKPSQEFRDELLTKEQQVENEIRIEAILSEGVREISTKVCSAEDLERAFKTFLGRFHGEGEGLRMELITGIEGMRLVAVFNWDDMG